MGIVSKGPLSFHERVNLPVRERFTLLASSVFSKTGKDGWMDGSCLFSSSFRTRTCSLLLLKVKDEGISTSSVFLRTCINTFHIHCFFVFRYTVYTHTHHPSRFLDHPSSFSLLLFSRPLILSYFPPHLGPSCHLIFLI